MLIYVDVLEFSPNTQNKYMLQDMNFNIARVSMTLVSLKMKIRYPSKY